MRAIHAACGDGRRPRRAVLAAAALAALAGCGDGGVVAAPVDAAAVVPDAAGDPDAPADLAGPAQLTIEPATQDFGDVQTCGGGRNSRGESEQVTFTVKNVGGSATASPAITSGADFIIAANGCAQVPMLAPGEACTVGVVFAPSAVGQRMGTLVATSPTAAAMAGLTGRGLYHGEVRATPAVLAFGPLVVGDTSAPRTFLLVSDVAQPLTGVSAAVTDSAEFAVEAGVCGATVNACARCPYSVTFKPAARGERTAKVVVSSADRSISVVALSGIGLAPARLVATPGALGFGKVPLTTASGDLTITVTNAGDEPVAALGIALGGVGADQFGVSSSCTPPLQGGASCTLEVTFAPTKLGVASAELRLTGSPGGSATVPLTGTGVPHDRLTIAPLASDFGSVNVGAVSGSKTLTVTNAGNTKAGPLAITKAGTDSQDFTILRDGCTSYELAPLATCTVQVGFAPQTSGAKTAVVVASSVAGATVSAVLMGSALSMGGLGVVPPMADFGHVPLGQPSAPATFTVTNNGDVGTGMVSVSIDPPTFALLADGCTGTLLPPHDSCTVLVQFTPGVVGGVQGTLTAVGSPGGVPPPALLFGTGTAD